MRVQRFSLLAALIGCVATHGSVLAAEASETTKLHPAVEKNTGRFEVEHIEYVTDRTVDEVAYALESATGDVTNGRYEREIASAKDKGDFEVRARAFEADSGFMRFLALDFGGFLSLMGPPTKVRQYTIGNPLIAFTMLKYDVQAALDVPVRLIIYQGKDGRTRIGYDRPSSLMSRIGDADLMVAARKLDEKLAALVERAAAP